MRKAALVLCYLAGAQKHRSSRQQLRTIQQRCAPANVDRAMLNPLKMLAVLLTEFSPAAAFSPTGVFPLQPQLSLARCHPSKLNPSRNSCSQSSPLMVETFEIAVDRTIPGPHTKVPQDGSILRGCTVTQVTDLGVQVMVDPQQNLEGIIYSTGLDVGFVKNIRYTFFEGDIFDVKVMCVSPTSGKLLLSRKAVQEQEGLKRHDLPNDGREKPLRVVPVEDDSPKDLARPSPDARVPDDEVIVRRCKVVKVEELGVYVELDSEQHLVGYIPSSGLDVGYVEKVEESFFVGDVFDVKVLGVFKTSGRLLVSRRAVQLDEGLEKHELPDDGRRKPKRFAHQLDNVPSPSEPSPSPDSSIPGAEAELPEAGNVVRGCKVARIEDFGIAVVLDSKQNLYGYIPSFGLDIGYIKDVRATFKEQDLLDVKVLGVSPISGKLLVSRKAVQEEEGVEKHELPNDGRMRPIRAVKDPEIAMSYL